LDLAQAALKGFNPYRVDGDDGCAHNPRVSPLAAEFLPFREKNPKTVLAKHFFS
jgi:hypothetical protein